ncbi:MAG TPA: UDP-N-acetylglucosamine--N-acetylmuramyl-(pentapeptide) pyrophosphoryl-undecaprenol N-acetylglucosamine transferase [Gemmatimonadaceae bacterium]|nr:UDP-N-acetylglucosamine--N-acetylmuramyl-(pentapeptide) pyrophosphoryl-undecaprenol N-acetylglucosamine transferase [Gemmatimonadaceae bacterium]
MRVLISGGGTGGHLYPGLAIARALTRLAPGIEPFFIGARRGIEREVLPTSGFPYLLVDIHPLYRARPWQSWKTVAGLWSAWRSVGALARRERPRVAIGTGGYASSATLAYALAHRIPYVLQEQNGYPGITTRLFSRWAREIYLGYPEARALLATRGTTVVEDTGNPIEPPPVPRPDRTAARARWGFAADDGAEPVVLLIFGGSQGARAINDVVSEWVLAGVPPSLRVIWATGREHYARYTHLASAQVRVEPYLSPIARAYAAADVALCRAGALTLAELCAWGIPAIAVPLPTAAADHQTANARALAERGAVRVVSQDALTPERLAEEMRALLSAPGVLEEMAAAARARARPHAADEIARRILRLAERRARSA